METNKPTETFDLLLKQYEEKALPIRNFLNSVNKLTTKEATKLIQTVAEKKPSYLTETFNFLKELNAVINFEKEEATKLIQTVAENDPTCLTEVFGFLKKLKTVINFEKEEATKLIQTVIGTHFLNKHSLSNLSTNSVSQLTQIYQQKNLLKNTTTQICVKAFC